MSAGEKRIKVNSQNLLDFAPVGATAFTLPPAIYCIGIVRGYLPDGLSVEVELSDGELRQFTWWTIGVIID